MQRRGNPCAELRSAPGLREQPRRYLQIARALERQFWVYGLNGFPSPRGSASRSPAVGRYARPARAEWIGARYTRARTRFGPEKTDPHRRGLAGRDRFAVP